MATTQNSSSVRVLSTSPHGARLQGPATIAELSWAELSQAAAQPDARLAAVYARLLDDAQSMEHARITRAFCDRVSHTKARQALAVGRTRSSGDVVGMLRAYLRTPDGGWGETRQAWEQLTEAVYACGEMTPRDAELAARDLVDAACAAGMDRHPSRS